MIHQKILIYVGLVISGGLIVAALLNYKIPLKYWFKTPATFQECTEASGAILESYPEQCVFRGKSFTNPEQRVGNFPLYNQDQLKTYSNLSYGLNFQYPTDGVLEPTQDDGKNLYVRIQNYNPNTNAISLRSGEYYIEARVSKNNSASGIIPESCTEGNLILNPTTRIINGVKIYGGQRGFGGDTGGSVFTMCAQTSFAIYIISVTEYDVNNPIGHQILTRFSPVK